MHDEAVLVYNLLCRLVFPVVEKFPQIELAHLRWHVLLHQGIISIRRPTLYVWMYVRSIRSMQS